MTENEVWKDVVGFEGLYKVSDKGNVFSVGQKRVQGKKRGGRMLKPRYDKDGYLRVTLCKNGKQKTRFIHRLVAGAFVPNPNGYSEINHLDENKVNNYVNNLEWCTREYNMNYGTLKERAAQKRSKKVKAVNIKTGEVLTFNSAKEARLKGYALEKVYMACRGTYKASTGKLIGDGSTYRGYKWEYEEAEENVSKQALTTEI